MIFLHYLINPRKEIGIIFPVFWLGKAMLRDLGISNGQRWASKSDLLDSKAHVLSLELPISWELNLNIEDFDIFSQSD